MKKSLTKMLVFYAVGIAALPVIAIAVLVLMMNSSISSIAESEFNKISLGSARQVVGDTLKICQIINKSQSEEAELARITVIGKLAELGTPKVLESFYDVDIFNVKNASEREKVRVRDLAFGKSAVLPKIDEDGALVKSSGDVKDAFELLKADTGSDFTLFQRVNDRGDLLAVCSTVADSDGNEMVGFFISGDSVIAKSILAKKSYAGVEHGGGMDYIINYYPITDESGDVVAAVSYAKIQNSIDYILRYLEGVRLGSNGYVWAIEMISDGTSVIRISRDANAKGMVVEKDMIGDRRTQTLEILNAAVAQGENIVGVKEYIGASVRGDDVIASYVYFKPWNMVFGATIYRSDFESGVEKISSSSENFILLLLPLGLGILMFAGFSAYAAAARGNEMIGELVESSKLIESGDIALAQANLARTIKSNRWSNLEIYNLSVALLKMSGNLSKLVSNVKMGGMNLAESAATLAGGAAQIEAIATAKAESIENVSKTVGSINNTVRLLKTGARRAAKNLDDTMSVLHNGEKLLRMLDENAEELLDATESVSSKLAMIKDRSDRIADLIVSINLISERINMLSLNASIEAEKAQKFGDGFASVAIEIKKLADSIAVSAMRISRIVFGMSASVEFGAKDMARFADRMRESSGVISKVTATVTAVEKQVANLGPQFEALATGVEKQSESAESISGTMRDMSASATQIRNEITEFKSAADAIDSTADEMKIKMSRFNLED